jgi:hypothetical protein
MEDRFNYYDVVAHIVPGTLVLGVLAIIPKVFGFAVPWPSSSAVTLAASIPIAYAVGQVVQAIASFLQPIYYKLWGGRPSDVMMEGKSRLTEERLKRMLPVLGQFFKSPTDTPKARAALFSDAMALCNREELGRVAVFNASYAFHRALLTTGVVASAMLGVALGLSRTGVTETAGSFKTSLIYLLVLAFVLTAVEFVRARQRGEYFSHEVLDMAYIRCRTGQEASTSQDA